jgi:hypothetical protein
MAVCASRYCLRKGVGTNQLIDPMKPLISNEPILFRPALRETLGWMAHFVVSRSRLRMRQSELAVSEWWVKPTSEGSATQR